VQELEKLDKYDYVVTIADEMKIQLENYFPELSKEKIKRIYNPFDFEEIRKKADDISSISDKEKNLLSDKYICTVTRLDEHQKDTTTLINSYQKLYNQNKMHHKLYIIGDGPHKIQLEQLVKSYKLENNILFFGKKINPYLWMKNAEVFILSSNFEGLPTVLVEAMAVETFVISTSCKTGPKEILMNGECGDLFEIGNVDELSEKLKYCINNEKYRNKKIKKATDNIVRFEKDNILFTLKNLLKK
jgi:glycosyltransferase involved in cell wall biosynthesis